MHYICLAAGKGTRFGHLGSYLQKCMYPIGLKPFLELSIDNLIQSKHLDKDKDQLSLIIGHHGEQIKQYFTDSYKGLAIRYIHQTEALGTGHALFLASETIQPKAPLIAWLADLYVPSYLFEHLQSHVAANVQTIAPGPKGEKKDLRVTLAGTLIAKAWQGADRLYDIGLWKLSPEVLRLMMAKRHGEYRMMPNLQYALEQGHKIGFVKTDEWIHLGGTQPTAEANVLSVVKRVFELRTA